MMSLNDNGFYRLAIFVYFLRLMRMVAIIRYHTANIGLVVLLLVVVMVVVMVVVDVHGYVRTYSHARVSIAAGNYV